MELGQEYIRFPSDFAGVRLFVVPSASLSPFRPRGQSQKKKVDKRPSVTMETSTHDIKALSMGLRCLNLANFMQRFLEDSQL